MRYYDAPSASGRSYLHTERLSTYCTLSACGSHKPTRNKIVLVEYLVRILVIPKSTFPRKKKEVTLGISEMYARFWKLSPKLPLFFSSGFYFARERTTYGTAELGISRHVYNRLPLDFITGLTCSHDHINEPAGHHDPRLCCNSLLQRFNIILTLRSYESMVDNIIDIVPWLCRRRGSDGSGLLRQTIPCLALTWHQRPVATAFPSFAIVRRLPTLCWLSSSCESWCCRKGSWLRVAGSVNGTDAHTP